MTQRHLHVLQLRYARWLLHSPCVAPVRPSDVLLNESAPDIFHLVEEEQIMRQ